MVQVVVDPMLVSMAYDLKDLVELVVVEREPRVAATMAGMQLELAQAVVVGHGSLVVATDLPGRLS
jgi:hypothetical protein